MLAVLSGHQCQVNMTFQHIGSRRNAFTKLINRGLDISNSSERIGINI